MEANYSAAPKELDRIVRDAEQGSAAGGVRVRVQPSIYLEGQYRPWPEVVWILRCQHADEAIAVKESLRACFAAMERKGAGEVTRILDAL